MEYINYGFAVMSPGVAFLALLATLAVIVGGLMASGVLSIDIHIEKDDRPRERDTDRIEADKVETDEESAQDEEVKG